MKVYLGDLRYDYSGILANDCMPLGIAYMKAVMDREDLDREIDSRLFVYPDRLADAIRREPPDVLMLSNYVWNEALSLYFVRLAKQVIDSLKNGQMIFAYYPNSNWLAHSPFLGCHNKSVAVAGSTGDSRSVASR